MTNTGVTSIIDAMGREQSALPIYQRGTLVDDVAALRMSTVYQRFGDWFAWLCCVAAVGLPDGSSSGGVPGAVRGEEQAGHLLFHRGSFGAYFVNLGSGGVFILEPIGVYGCVVLPLVPARPLP